MEGRNTYKATQHLRFGRSQLFSPETKFWHGDENFKSLLSWRPVCHLSGGDVVFVILVHNYLLNRSRYLLLNV